MKITKQTLPTSGTFATMSGLKEVECLMFGKVVLVSMPKLVVIENDGIVYYRLPSMEERNGILNSMDSDDESAFTLSHKLVYPKISYIISECGRVAIHPTLHQRMKLIWKMSNKFSPQMAINMCANHCAFIVSNCSEELTRKEIIN